MDRPETVTSLLRVVKADDERRIVWGFASMALDDDGRPIADNEGDVIDPVALERAAYRYVRASLVGDRHVRFDGVGALVESFFVTPDKLAVLGSVYGFKTETRRVGWFVGIQIDDHDVWARVKAGSYQGLSIGLRGDRRRLAA